MDGEDAQAFAHGFVVRGEEYQILMHDQLDVALPRWVDDDKIRLGQEFFEQHDMEIAAALFCAALPMATRPRGALAVLLETAELVSDVSRRIAETGRLLFDVMLPILKVAC